MGTEGLSGSCIYMLFKTNRKDETTIFQHCRQNSLVSPFQRPRIPCETRGMDMAGDARFPFVNVLCHFQQQSIPFVIINTVEERERHCVNRVVGVVVLYWTGMLGGHGFNTSLFFCLFFI